MDILWEKTIKIIQEKVSQQNFDTWIRPIHIASMEGDQVILSVPNRFFRDWLVENYLSLIRDSMKSGTGVPLQVEFVIDQESSQSHAGEESSPSRSTEKTPVKKTSRARVHSSLNVHYSFERFVVGASNQFAHAASAAVAEQPAKNYNPLFI